MICKHCGSQLSGNICPSCKQIARLSYTSHELADLMGLGVNSSPDENELKSAYNNGFDDGQKRGLAEGHNSAQKEYEIIIKRQKRFFSVVSVSAALVLALLFSIVAGAIRYNSGYRNGISAGRQEQLDADASQISDSYQQGFKAGHDEGYQVGFQTGYDQGLLVTPAPSPKTNPTHETFLLTVSSKGDEVLKLQERLIALGYLDDKQSDGDFGPATENAVKHFQTNSGVKPTGTVDQEIWDLIMSEEAVPATRAQAIITVPTSNPAETAISGNGTDDRSEESVKAVP